jgi:3-hydroxyacyl-CoA dehydrogenase
VLVTGPAVEGALGLALTGRLAELAAAPGTEPAGLARAWTLLRRTGHAVILTGPGGPVAARLAAAGAQAAQHLAAAGVAPEAIAAALAGFGLPGPRLTEAPAGAPRALEAGEILGRWLGAVQNEGVRLLAEGVALAALDLDLAAVTAMGFPRQAGGPMHQALERGLLVLRRDLRLWAAEDPFWTPAPGWDAVVSDGHGFRAIERG